MHTLWPMIKCPGINSGYFAFSVGLVCVFLISYFNNITFVKKVQKGLKSSKINLIKCQSQFKIQDNTTLRVSQNFNIFFLSKMLLRAKLSNGSKCLQIARQSREKFIEPAKTDWSQDKTVLVSTIAFVYVSSKFKRTWRSSQLHCYGVHNNSCIFHTFIKLDRGVTNGQSKVSKCNTKEGYQSLF